MRRRKRGRNRVRRLVKRLFFIIFYFGMPPFDRARFLCKRRARDAASTVEIKSAQFQVSRYAAFFPFPTLPLRLHPRIFPSIIASPRLTHLKCVSKISFLYFFQKKTRPVKISTRFEIPNFGSKRREGKISPRTTGWEDTRKRKKK